MMYMFIYKIKDGNYETHFQWAKSYEEAREIVESQFPYEFEKVSSAKLGLFQFLKHCIFPFIKKRHMAKTTRTKGT